MSIAPDDIEDSSRAESACETWKRYDGSLTVRSNTAESALLRAEGWSGRLAIYARGDFDGDGLEDLLIRRDAHSNEGSARDTSLFVVTQKSPRGCVLVTRLIGPASVNGM